MGVKEKKEETSVVEIWQDHPLHQATKAKAPREKQTDLVGAAHHMVEERFYGGSFGATRYGEGNRVQYDSN